MTGLQPGSPCVDVPGVTTGPHRTRPRAGAVPDGQLPAGHPREQSTRDLLVAAVVAPLRPLRWPTAALASLVVLLEAVGLLVRRACSGAACADDAWSALLDMDALGSLPRALITVLLAGVALACLRAAHTAGRDGAVVWWVVLALGAAVLAVAKHFSLHSLIEVRLAPLVPGADVQLLFLVASAAGLAVATVAGRWVRRDTRTTVVTWLALYAAASVGLAAVTLLVGRAGAVVADLATFVEETAEGLTALGLLVVVHAASRTVAARRPVTARPAVDPDEWEKVHQNP